MRRVKYVISKTRGYDRDLRKIFRKNRELFILIEDIVVRISRDPFSTSLRTHLVVIPSLGKVYSSRVTGDIRIIWILSSKKIIVLYRIGGHSGSSKVYR